MKGIWVLEPTSLNNIQPVLYSLSNAPALIIPLVREIPSEFLKRRPAPTKWSAHEHVCHLAAVHPLFSARLDLMLTEMTPYIKPYFPDSDTPVEALLAEDLDEALIRFEAGRAALVERLKTLSMADWQRTAEHGEYNTYSVYIMFRHLALHDLLHAYRIEEIRLKKEWI